MIQSRIKVTEECSDTLQFNYRFTTERVTYSISDLSGAVCLRGKLDSGSSNSLNIDSLSKGYYTFCIIDGDNVARARFRKN